MFQELAGSRKTLGDVDILFHQGIYHLFHLVLPNHDYIAHAVSNDCIHWRRVENAIVIGHPGAWDDSMLWTVHVTPHPSKKGRWRMFYTGLSRRDKGLKQRIGLAESDNLYTWRKSTVNWVDRRSDLPYDLPGRPEQPTFDFDPDSCFPLQPDPEYYESNVDEGRHWVSWRDPFYFREGAKGWLICAARVADGPIIRRGCVALMEETDESHFEIRSPLHHTGLYDDVEVPNLLQIDGDYYLIGSLREDAKVRYWRSDSPCGRWRSPGENILIGSGNYAGRVTEDEKGFLFWSFFSERTYDRKSSNLMPPPKRLCKNALGDLELKSYEGFDRLVEREIDTTKICPLIKSDDDMDKCVTDGQQQILESEHHFQIFLFDEDVHCFRFQTKISIGDSGSCGIVFGLDRETRDGYYLSLNLRQGVAQLSAWGADPTARGELVMIYSALQEGYWTEKRSDPTILSLIVYGSYIELSVDGKVILCLADSTYSKGGVGVYLESATVRLLETTMEILSPPDQSDDHLTTG